LTKRGRNGLAQKSRQGLDNLKEDLESLLYTVHRNLTQVGINTEGKKNSKRNPQPKEETPNPI